MLRCLQTREIVAAAIPFAVRDELREVDFGTWEGKTLAWLESYDPGRVSERHREPVTFRPPEGESFADIAPRLGNLVDSLDEEGTLLIVSHRGTLGVLERLLRGLSLRAPLTPLGPGELRILSVR